MKNKTNLHKRLVIFEKELVRLDIDAIGNLEFRITPKPMFRDEEYGNCKLVVGGGELTRNIDKKKKPRVNRCQSHKSIRCL